MAHTHDHLRKHMHEVAKLSTLAAKLNAVLDVTQEMIRADMAESDPRAAVTASIKLINDHRAELIKSITG